MVTAVPVGLVGLPEVTELGKMEVMMGTAPVELAEIIMICAQLSLPLVGLVTTSRVLATDAVERVQVIRVLEFLVQLPGKGL